MTRLLTLSNAIKKRYPGSKIAALPGSPTLFVQIKDSRSSSKTAAEILFEDTKTEVADGSLYGEDDSFVRINIMAFSEDLANFANRLLSKEKYSKYHMLISSKVLPEPVPVCGKDGTTVEYVANPNDRVIQVDASKGNVLIVLPQFLGYEQPLKLRIKRTDDSNHHKVDVQSDFFLLSIKYRGYISLVWRQPFYRNGRWKVVDMKKANLHHKQETRLMEHLPHNREIGKLFLI